MFANVKFKKYILSRVWVVAQFVRHTHFLFILKWHMQFLYMNNIWEKTLGNENCNYNDNIRCFIN